MTYENRAINYGIVCPICCRPVLQSGKGRPAHYHPECRKFEQLAVWMDSLLSEQIKATPDGKKKIRSRLWYLANLINKKQ